MEAAAAVAVDAAGLAACDSEPIHIPGSIQPYGMLLALGPRGLPVLQASANCAALFGRPVEEVIGHFLGELLPMAEPTVLASLEARVPDQGSLVLKRLHLGGGARDGVFHATAHRSDGSIILELEPAGADGDADPLDGLHLVVSACAAELQAAGSVEEVAAVAARQTRRITGFDRVLVYRFDEDENGTVVAEDRNGALPSYLDLRFPASDIPRQARELYRLNRQRLIPDATYVPVPIVPALSPLNGRPLDLSFASLRSVSPIHVEYMRNMGTGSSMSVSLLCDGRLWGLISCHSLKPRQVPLEARMVADLVGQIVSLQIAAKEHGRDNARRMELKGVESRLLAYMAAEDRFTDGLASHPHEVLRLTAAQGAAILHEGGCTLLGQTPPEPVVRRIAEWLGGGHRRLHATDGLADELPELEAHRDTASGLLAIAISQIHPSYLLWFRPEVVRTVRWGGDPRQPVQPRRDDVRLHPRRSFELWKETVHGRSLPWQTAEIDAARGLQDAVVGIVLRKAEELAALSEELTRSNKELEAFSYSVSHDLRAPFRHIVGYAELLKEQDGPRLSERGRRFVATIIESAMSAGRLIDDLLSFSQMSRSRLMPLTVDMGMLVAEVLRGLAQDIGQRSIDWRIGDLAPAHADPVMLRLVLENLLANAIKYTRTRVLAVVEIGSWSDDAQSTYFVRDNGVGFDMAYASKLFGVFQRLHRMEEFEGTGIGLANVRRIVERHGGRVWAEAALDKGATFFFSLPNATQAG